MEINELLCNAVQTEQCEVTELLIKSNADVNYVDKVGKFPLYHAYEKKKISQMKLLLAHKADINKKYRGFTMLHHVCAQKGSPDKEMIRMLMDNNANPNIKADEKTSNHALLCLTEKNDMECVSLLLSYPCTDINLQNDDRGVTSLRSACAHGFGDMALLLLNKGADPNIQGSEGFSPLMRSIINNEIVTASILLFNDNVKLNLQDDTGRTALHHACDHKRCDIMYLLLLRGADRTIKNNDGKTAFECCTSDRMNWFFKNYEEINKTSVKTINENIPPTPVEIVTESVASDPIKSEISFKVPNASNLFVRQGTIGSHYQKWNKLFGRWDPVTPVPMSYNDMKNIKCEYVEEKIPYHVVCTNGSQHSRIRFHSIVREDETIKYDLYE